MSEHITKNGYEIEQSSEKLSAAEFRRVVSHEYGIDGEHPAERISQLQELSTEGVAIMIEHINKGLQGTEASLMNHDSAMKIGETTTLQPEDRHQVFSELVASIKASPDTVNPARVADVLALGVVMLHPFHDGNGRTARALGLLFRDHYDGENYENDFSTVAESRDDARARGGFMINGYTPQFSDGFDQSDPAQVSRYLAGLLQEESPGAYTSCFGQAPLRHDRVDG